MNVPFGLPTFKWANITLLAHFTTWSQMTFDLGMWPLTLLTYEGSHVTSMTHVWFQLDFNFLTGLIWHFQPIIQLDLQMTFDLGRPMQIRPPPKKKKVDRTIYHGLPNARRFEVNPSIRSRVTASGRTDGLWKQYAFHHYMVEA